MTDPTSTIQTDTAEKPTEVRRLLDRYKREQEGKPVEPERTARPAAHLSGEKLDRPDDVLDVRPEAAEFLLHPERWGCDPIWIMRRRTRHNGYVAPEGNHFTEGALLRSDDPHLADLPALGWEAD
jgi:hypothetical protein